MARFAKGMKVWKTFYGIGGYTEDGEDVVESVKDGVVRTRQCENGITFDAVTGKELENFFPGMHQEIIPLTEKGKPKPTALSAPKARKAAKAPSQRLTAEDIANPMFDRVWPVRRNVNGRPAFEWVTYTDSYVQIGCTYYLDNGQLWVVAFEPRNAKLYDHAVYTLEQFAKAMKAVDRAYKKLAQKK